MKKVTFKLSVLTSALILAGFAMPAFATKTTDVGTVKIVGDNELGGGLIVEETGTRTRSTVTKAAIQKAGPSSNVYQLLNNLPSVNANTQDETGLFGGTFHMRGFGADQIGFTINNAPVNDEGNYAIYPAEYLDKENLCGVYVTQGSVDISAPHIGAAGGNVGMVSCDPTDQAGGSFTQSFGSQNYRNTFIRGETGYLGPVKAFVSYSKKSADQAFAPGDAVTEHVDFGGQWDITADTTFKTHLLYNHQTTAHYDFFNKKKDFDHGKAKYVYTTKQPMHDGNKDADWGFNKNTYWKNSYNPFKNYLWTANLTSRINDKLTVEADPYFWYGYGSGGYQPKQLTVSQAFDGGEKFGGIKNPYIGSGIANTTTNTKVGVWRSSLTETNRPGITLKANYDLNDQNKILAGVWYEHANHKQTKPATTVNNNGGISDIWQKDYLVHNWDGSLYQGRNQKTFSDASSWFLKDTITATDKLTIEPGMRYVYVKRKFNYYSSDANAVDTSNTAKYYKFLPSLGASYQANDNWQVYGDIAKSAKTPDNYSIGITSDADNIVNGKPAGKITYGKQYSQKMETSLNSELGARYFGEMGTASLSLYNVDYKNRQVSGKDPATGEYTYFNAGNTTLRGLEFQAGTTAYHGFSLFGSFTYAKSKIGQDIQAYTTIDPSNTEYVKSKGKEVPLDPNWMASLGIQYANGPFFAGLTGKYTGSQYTNYTNTEKANPYTVFNLATGYEFPSGRILKHPKIQLNVNNLFDRNYIYADNFTTSGNSTFYRGGPRFTTVSFSTDF